MFDLINENLYVNLFGYFPSNLDFSSNGIYVVELKLLFSRPWTEDSRID